ncbi:MAG: FmdB family zinc ribbon protein [Acidimicrobiales bacterium]
MIEKIPMTIYEYRCGTCGPFIVSRTMGSAPARASCPECQASSRRVFGPPGLTRTHGALRRALDRAAASACDPAVVSR